MKRLQDNADKALGLRSFFRIPDSDRFALGKRIRKDVFL